MSGSRLCPRLGYEGLASRRNLSGLLADEEERRHPRWEIIDPPARSQTPLPFQSARTVFWTWPAGSPVPRAPADPVLFRVHRAARGNGAEQYNNLLDRTGSGPCQAEGHGEEDPEEIRLPAR